MSSSAEENLTRIYTINLGKAQLTPRYRRTDRVINMIREFAKKHMKSAEVKLDQELNRHVWQKGKAHPPRKLRVRMMKDEDGIVIVSPYEEAVRKEDAKSIVKAEDVESKPTEEPLAETEKAQKEEPEDQQDTKEKETTKTKKGKKKTEANTKKGRKTKK
jgi:large subunit ribosomal protein L31e